MVEPGKAARVMAINDSLETMQDAVGGLIEEYSKEKNVPLLLEYAQQLRVKPKVMRYMEVLL